MNIRDRRIQYETAGLQRDDLHDSPIVQWHRWYEDAVEADLPEPNAMVISTVDEQGLPDSRIVLARGIDDTGITFFGNYRSAKGIQLEATALASAVFPWLGLLRQVRMRGTVALLKGSASDEYFASRPRDSQLGAWASPQSQVIESRAELQKSFDEVALRFSGVDVPRPPHWGGWLLVPQVFEFWQGRPNRLHDRFRYIHEQQNIAWVIDRLAP